MKKIIVPEQQEESVYYSDFSGKCFGSEYPAVNVVIKLNSSSSFFDKEVVLHLTDREFSGLFDYIKPKLSEEFKIQLKKANHSLCSLIEM